MVKSIHKKIIIRSLRDLVVANPKLRNEATSYFLSSEFKKHLLSSGLPMETDETIRDILSMSMVQQKVLVRDLVELLK